MESDSNLIRQYSLYYLDILEEFSTRDKELLSRDYLYRYCTRLLEVLSESHWSFAKYLDAAKLEEASAQPKADFVIDPNHFQNMPEEFQNPPFDAEFFSKDC